jgi:hypothetical protein
VRDVDEGRAGRLNRALRSFHPDSMPLLARRNYRHELVASFFLPLLLVVADGNIVGVLVKLAFSDVVPKGRLNVVVAAIAASTALANIVSFVWVRLSHAMDKVRFAVRLQMGALVTVGLITLVPRTEVGLYMLGVFVIVVRMCWAGYVTVRSTIWRQNYASHERARVTGRIMTVQIMLLGIMGLLLATLMGDKLALLSPRLGLEALGLEPMDAFRAMGVTLTLLSLIGVWQFSKIRVRGRALLERNERTDSGQENGPSFNPAGVLGIVIEDRRYGAYMACQMLLGLGNLMLGPLIPIVLKERFDVGYFEGILLSSSIQLLMMPLTIPLWARLLDRTHVVRFRSFHSWIFVAGIVCFTLAVKSGAAWLLYLGAMIRGTGFGGGVLAWNLGHHDFAPPEKAGRYMGAHVTLTGIRGLVSPFVGVGLYELLEAWRPGSGWGVFALCVGLSTLGAIGFVIFAIRMGRARVEHEVEVAPPSRMG